MPRARPSLLSLLGQRRPQTTHEAGSSTPNNFHYLLDGHREKFLVQEDAYRSISKPKSFAGATNNAKHIIIQLADDPKDLLSSGLIVLGQHLTIPSFFRQRPDQDDTRLRPLQGHMHFTLKYKEHTDRPQDPPREIRAYYCYEQGQTPGIGLVDNKSGKPLDPEIKRQLKARAIKLMMPLITEMDQYIGDFEGRKFALESRITAANARLATATEALETWHFAQEARELYQEWLQIMDSDDYKHVKNFRSNGLLRTDVDGFTVQSAGGRLTKDRFDKIWRVTAKAAMSGLRDIINQLETEQAQSSGEHKSAVGAAPKHHKKSRKARRSRGKEREKAAKKPAPRPEETLETYLEKAGNWVAAYLQLQGALNRGDFPRVNQLLQGRMFKNKCILFYLDSESLGILCRPENIAVFKNILTSQKDALILDEGHNKVALANLIKKLIQTGNLEGLLALHKLRVNLEKTLCDATGKGLRHHLIDVAYKENKDKFYAWFFANLHEQGVRCLDNEQIVKVDFGDRVCWLDPLKRAACMGLPSLTRAFMKTGVKDSLISVRYVIKKDEGKDEKGRCDVTACDFVVEDMVSEEIEAERFVEQSELLLALCNSHDSKETDHSVATGAQIFWQLMQQSEGGNKEEKTALLVDCLAKAFMLSRIFKSAEKHGALDNTLVGAVYNAIGNISQKLQRVKAQRNPRLVVARKLEEIRAWMALLKFAIHDSVCLYSQRGQKAGLIDYVMREIDGFKQRYQPDMTLRTDLDKGSQGQDQTVEFNPVHIVEIMVGKLLKLFPVSSVSVDKIVECIKAQVLFAFEDVEFDVLKHVERHVLDGFHLMLAEQPVNNIALAKSSIQGQLTDDEAKADAAINDPKMLFLEHQQAEFEVSEPPLRAMEC
ncbi:hypothetical protein [Piscirickettsia salmonis]|uniref:hypothetical protein n=1 Tax=Piscirickettsia salmonis TaxID=1238 RepID=UPI000332D272|nr:hypothetical protein [Piscirickettsia salmonis]APS57247.1 hypothetical protein AVI52_08290 [Piscirickettsia salmonis]ERL60849.1 hypothetical protein K661_02829 [Piscirickettsia salmonis LF-89 = ATCC VR-1361]PEQ15470.1 hypothetical protein X973_12565 [Piscirickettsia salmonis]QGN78648.1 hypothetical protein Psal001_02891 [Piscirickettsia salmonis]QGN82230.1 hypothetical protein Psal002_02908 [Piscirickettsia salmonis]